MKIMIAKTAGFCMGVRRAVDIALDASNRIDEPIYSFGPLIHNPQVLSLLKEKGLAVIDQVPDKGSGTVIIRAHGVPPDKIKGLEKAGYNVIDATCPRVIKVQTIIKKHSSQGEAIIIVGDHDHPEVTGLLGYAGERKYVVDSLESMDNLPVFDKAIIVAQTTQNIHFFNRVKEWSNKRAPHYTIINTICDSTEKRQAEASRLAESVDAVIVVGGFNSGNTRRLAEVAKEAGKPSFHVEDETGLDMSYLSEVESIGITAGASTPNWVINNIYRKIETLPYKKLKRWHHAVLSIQRILLMTNIYVAIGAGCLTYASSKLQGIDNNLSYIMIAFLYVLSMHTFNNLIETKADRYNNPDRAFFYQKNFFLMACLAVTAGGAGLLTAYTKGLIPFLILLAMSIIVGMYNLKLVPERFSLVNYRRIKDIPGSKTILIVLAWGVATSLFPVISAKGALNTSTFSVLIWAMGIVFVRTAFFDILDMQGDRIVGRETLPIFLGEQKTRALLKKLLVFLSVLPLLFGLFGLLPFSAAILFIVPVLLFLIIIANENRKLLPGFRLVFLVETGFVLIGMLAFLIFTFS